MSTHPVRVATPALGLDDLVPAYCIDKIARRLDAPAWASHEEDPDGEAFLQASREEARKLVASALDGLRSRLVGRTVEVTAIGAKPHADVTPQEVTLYEQFRWLTCSTGAHAIDVIGLAAQSELW